MIPASGGTGDRRCVVFCYIVVQFVIDHDTLSVVLVGLI